MMKKIIIQILFFLFLISSFTFSFTMNPNEKSYSLIDSINTKDSLKNEFMKRKYIYTTGRTDTPPKIDGILNDECWKTGNWTDFTFQREPVDCGLPTERTIFKIFYDNKYIYAAFKLYDKEPEKISRIMSNRDNITGDVIVISFDSYFDKRSSFDFGVTASGVKIDYTVSNSTELNYNWNPVYDVKVSEDDSSWNAEFKIPFSELRYADKKDQLWGLHIWRWIYRKTEEDNWEANPISASSWLDFYGELGGIKDIPAGRRIEVLPYILGQTHNFKKEEGNPFRTGNTKKIDFGADGKVGISSDFTIDLTINPDFGQVEADPSQISLSAFELEFEEKRQFFIEGKGIFNFSPLFYSRRIGKMPSFYPGQENNEYIKMPEKTSILGALKLTGKTRDGLSIGILESITNKENAEISSPGNTKSLTVEPLTNYFMSRVQKDFDHGNVILGGALTAVNRDINDDNLKFLTTSSYSGGIDFKYQWDNKNYYILSNGMFSSVKGDRQSLSRIQLSPTHYFQRPDADYLTYDTNQTSLSGYGGIIEIGKSGGGAGRFTENIKLFSPGFEVNDIGYLPMVDRIYQSTQIGYVIQTPSDFFRNYSLYFNQNSTWNFGGDKLELSFAISPSFTFLNNWKLSFNFERNTGSISPYLIWGGPSFKSEGNWNLVYSLSTDYTRDISMGITLNHNLVDDNISSYISSSFYYSFRVTNSLAISGDIFYDNTKENLQYLCTKYLNNNIFYFLSYVNQKALRLTARISYTITPDLTVQYYGSPFFATRKYSNLKKVTNPKAEEYNNRFHQYTENEITFDIESNSYLIDDNLDGRNEFIINNPDMSYRDFRSNLVLKWEYNPGSTIYLVWSQGRMANQAYESMKFNRDINGLFNVYPDNIFMIKLNHWFSL
jgi:hypothetical protein